MAFSEVFEKLGRAVFESPFETKRLARDAPEFAEIRLAALDVIKSKSHRVGGRYVFPYDLVRVHLLGIPEEQEAIFRSGFITKYFSDELKAALNRASYRFPASLAVEFISTPRLPSGAEKWLAVETAMRQGEDPAAAVESRSAVLEVVNGIANCQQIALKKARTNIGRTAELYRGAEPFRRNDLAFEGSDEAGKSVSREHAHIVRSTNPVEYRLFNDRVYKGEGNCGLWVVRDGLSQPVHRSSRGTSLQAGDEIHLGTAVVRFEFDNGETESDKGAPSA